MATTAISTPTANTLDVNSIVTGLMSIERRPIAALTTRQSGYQAKISALGSIQSQMVSLQTAAKALGSSSSSTLQAYQSTSSDTSVFTASATSTAVAGAYSLNVTSLAQSQNLVAAGQVSSTAAIGNGVATTVNFDFGTISGGTLAGGTYTGATFTSGGAGIKSITIDSTNNTLQGISAAINAAGMGVTATIVNDGSATPNRLVLTSNATGAATSVKITTSGGDGTVDTLLANDPAAVQHLNQTVAAQNANFTVNGIAISSATNTVSNAIQGVTLNLSKVTATPVTLTVARDPAAITTAVTTFVDAYNKLYTAMKNSSAYKSGSALSGDATLRTLQTQMRDIASSTVTGGTMTTLGGIGINFKADGTMQFDSAKLASAMASNFNDVTNLLSSATGYATKFDNMATNALMPTTGAFAARTNNFTQYAKTITDQIATLETRMTGIEKKLRTQYSQLNVLLTQMGSTSTYLSQQLSRL